ncbi:low molecular weight protein tyrosine phosphatase family protein [Enterobacterales bacterium AE_CKDN230030158-1A_HGKHYDSX7]
MRRALFICSRNRLRSPTAEAVFASWPEVETDSAGLAPDAEVPLSTEQLEWADLVFVMERRHRQALLKRFPAAMRGKRLVCLDIPDDYAYLQPELVLLLERKAGPLLQQERA